MIHDMTRAYMYVFKLVFLIVLNVFRLVDQYKILVHLICFILDATVTYAYVGINTCR